MIFQMILLHMFKLTTQNQERDNQLAQVPMTAYGGAGPQWQLNNGRFATAGGYFNVMNQDTSFGFRSIAIGPRIYSYDYDIFGPKTWIRW